jgi:hypothetical protein
MLVMDVGDVALAIYTTLTTGGLGALIWTRLNRIEAVLATKADRAEFEALRQELATKADKGDVGTLRQELATKAVTADLDAIRREMAIMRSDLTQVALAVGAKRSQASEG